MNEGERFWCYMCYYLSLAVFLRSELVVVVVFFFFQKIRYF